MGGKDRHLFYSVMADQIIMGLTNTRLGQADVVIKPVKSCELAICLFRKDGRGER